MIFLSMKVRTDLKGFVCFFFLNTKWEVFINFFERDSAIVAHILARLCIFAELVWKMGP